MNLLVTGAWKEAKEYLSEIEEMGHTVKFLQYEKDSLPCEYDWIEGVICNGLFLYHPIERFSKLKYIQLTSAGYDRIPMDYVNKCKIGIYNARGVYSIPMAEYAIGGVLQLYKQAIFFRENQNAHSWKKHRGLMELSGKTVCIVGCGSVGTECAKRFLAFDCKVIGVDVNLRRDKNFNSIFLLEELDRVLPWVDILVLTLPLTSKTFHMINEEKLSLLKDGAILVNIARGAVVDHQGLIVSLNGKLGGAVLDVFEEEPLKGESVLWDMENVIITPHNSFQSDGNEERLKSVIMENLKNA